MSGQDKNLEQKFYDELFKKRKRFDQIQVEIYEDVAQKAREGSRGNTVLDLGCGSGTQTLCLIEKNFRVISADLSFEATRISKATMEKFGHSPQVVNADAEFLPFPDASVDACVCSLFLHHFKNLDGVASELQRIVRPGGVVVATDANAHNPFAFLFFNIVHKVFPISGVTKNQRAIWSDDIRSSFEKFGFGDFKFDSFSTKLNRDWLDDSFAFSLNFYARAFCLKLSNTFLPKISRGNGLLSVFHRLP